MSLRPAVAAATAALFLAMTACTGGGADATAAGSTPPNATPPNANATPPNATPAPSTTATAGSGTMSAQTSPSASPSTADDVNAVARKVKADELGSVPVLMYHQLRKDPGSNRYDITPKEFRAELQRLYDENYRPVTAGAYAAGDIDIPAGTHPVVLTFDDATTSQFALDGDRPRKGTAVAILQEFAAGHQGFEPRATFFVNDDPFANQSGVLGWLHDNGFEVAVHTTSHTILRDISSERVQKEIVTNARMIERETGAFPTTFALPLGVHPKKEKLAAKGSYDGTSYDFAGVFLVGAGPARSPFHEKFDGENIPRIRSQNRKGPDRQWESGGWLDWYADNPERRFTSDGDATVVSFPAAKKGEADLPEGLTANAY